jgi:hypothetical protein
MPPIVSTLNCATDGTCLICLLMLGRGHEQGLLLLEPALQVQVPGPDVLRQGLALQELELELELPHQV